MRNFSQAGGADDAAELDTLDDGAEGYNSRLTILDSVDPDSAISTNRTSSSSESGWHYSRRLSVRPFAGVDARDIRIVSAMLYRDEPDGSHTLLADVGTVLKTPGDAFPTTQVYDVYFLAIENIPGWWVYMSNIKPLMASTITDLQARNPGLEFRAHWITTAGYGRDQRYLPYVNESVDSEQNIDWVYFYPGTMPDGEAADFYYVPNQINARINVDGSERNGHEDDTDSDDYNPWPYALADLYNHGMRYVDEVRHFSRRCDADTEESATPTWRLLLERMCSRPADFENAILVNLHGELLPMPAIRNYSDAAKTPADYPGVRVVTHPRYLRTPTNTDLQLRVYAYRDPYQDLAVDAAEAVAPPVTVVLKNVNLAGRVNEAVNPTLLLSRVYGGVDGSAGSGQDGLADPYGSDDAPDSESNPGAMYAMVAYVDDTPTDPYDNGDTIITLYNTPLICPYDPDSGSPSDQSGTPGRSRSRRSRTPPAPTAPQGLPDTWRLYGLEYIPSSTEAAGDFSQDLTTATDNPKNTARWIITIPQARRADIIDELQDPIDGVDEVLNRVTIETRVGADRTTGVMWPPADRHQPENLSRTYAWWTDDVTDVPLTERSQYIGDPRHSPYADLKDQAPVLSFQNHYNWWFDNFKKSGQNVFGNWPGYSQSRIENDESNSSDGWADDHIHFDVPRYLETLRTALITTDSVYTTLTGYSYYYMGIGNEIGYDSANGFSRGIPVSKKPFYGTSGTRTEQTITSGGNPTDGNSIGNGTKLIKRGRSLSSGYWWGKHWLGELYPDDDWATWESDGNLPTGNGSTEYVRMRRDYISENLPRGTSFVYGRRCMQPEGCNSFFLIGTRSRTFYHDFNSGSGELTEVGEEIAEKYAFPLPTYADINRPFALNWRGSSSWRSNPDFDFTTDYPHNSAEFVRILYDHPWNGSDGNGSAIVALTNPTGDHSSFQIINGLSQTIESGSAFIAKWALLSLVHGFLTAGEPDTASVAANRIVQLPRLQIRQPTIITELSDPDEITVQWSTEFRRWDGQNYTQYYPDDFEDDTWLSDLRYVLMYSKDNGETWQYMDDDAQATPGECPESPGYLLQDAFPDDDETYAWEVPDDEFPQGSYLIRVEVYRDTKPLHYAYHVEKIYIDR